jgi:hypothetical protein
MKRNGQALQKISNAIPVAPPIVRRREVGLWRRSVAGVAGHAPQGENLPRLNESNLGQRLDAGRPNPAPWNLNGRTGLDALAEDDDRLTALGDFVRHPSEPADAVKARVSAGPARADGHIRRRAANMMKA